MVFRRLAPPMLSSLEKTPQSKAYCRENKMSSASNTTLHAPEPCRPRHHSLHICKARMVRKTPTPCMLADLPQSRVPDARKAPCLLLDGQAQHHSTWVSLKHDPTCVWGHAPYSDPNSDSGYCTTLWILDFTTALYHTVQSVYCIIEQYLGLDHCSSVLFSEVKCRIFPSRYCTLYGKNQKRSSNAGGDPQEEECLWGGRRLVRGAVQADFHPNLNPRWRLLLADTRFSVFLLEKLNTVVVTVKI